MYPFVYSIVWLISLLPLRVLYVFSDLIYLLAYLIVKYRTKVVRSNLQTAFPTKDKEEITRIERDFYHFFADYIVETIKVCSISSKEMRKRMEIVGVGEMVNHLKAKNQNFAFIYLAHYGNWEWIASLAERIHEEDADIKAAQIYHPLRNKAFDRLFLKMRARFGGESVGMKETLRYILTARRQKQPVIMGFIADQAPKWNSIHHWTDFLNHKTPVFTGTEQIGKQVDAQIYYGHIERPHRGYYRCTITLLTDEVKKYEDFKVTDLYFKMLEQTINLHPGLWLWSHKRWKRTYEEYLLRQREDAKAVD